MLLIERSMKMNLQLLKLIDVVSAQKGVYVRIGKGYQLDPVKSDLFANIVGEIEPFVFAPQHEYPKDLDEPLDDCIVDAPFKNFSFEILGKCITVAGSNQPECNIECIAAHEFEPNKFIFFILYTITGNRFVFGEVSDDTDVGISITNLVKEYTTRIAREASGTEKTGQRTKLRYKGDKKLIKIKHIIHITPKSQKEKYVANTLKQIDWTFRWTQRGHWRDIGSDSLGKDRRGVYCIPGKTWVIEGIKGPKDKPLIRKTRLVSE